MYEILHYYKSTSALSMKQMKIHKRYLERKASNEATAKASKETQKRTLQQLSPEETKYVANKGMGY